MGARGLAIPVFMRYDLDHPLVGVGAGGLISFPFLAMAAGVTCRLWSISDLVGMLEAEERGVERAA